jgi:hypothetical protein
MGPKRVDPLASARSIVQQCIVRDFCQNAQAATIRSATVHDRQVYHDGAIIFTESPPSINECHPKPIAPSTAFSDALLIARLLSCMAILVWRVSATVGSLEAQNAKVSYGNPRRYDAGRIARSPATGGASPILPIPELP